MDTHEHWLAVVYLSLHESKMVFTIELALIEVQVELAVVRRQLDHQLALDEFLTLLTIADEALDAAYFQIMGLGEFHQVRQSGHGAVIIENLTNHGSGLNASKVGQIHRCFGVSGAAQ